MNEQQFKELVDKVGAEAAEKIKAQFDALEVKSQEAMQKAIAGLPSQEQVAKLTEQLSTMEKASKDQGLALANLLNSGNGGENKVTVEGILEKFMPEIEKVFNGRQPGVSLTIDANKAAAVMTTTNTTNNTTFSVPVEIVESMSMAEFAGKRYGRQFIADITDETTVANMEQYTTWLEEGSEQGAFAIVAEGALKPLVSTNLVRNYAAAQKIAGKYVVTEEFVKWRQNAYNIIRRLMQDKLVRDYSALVVTGINTAAAGYVGTTLDDTIVAPNDYDAVGAVAAQIQSLNFVPNVIILNPQDAWRLRLTKDTQNNYVFVNVAQNGEQRIFGMALIESTYQTAGYFTMGEAGLYKVEKEAVQMRMGYGIDSTTSGGNVTGIVSDFDNNRFRIILEMFFKQWLPTPYIGSFVRAQFSTVKAALLKP